MEKQQRSTLLGVGKRVHPEERIKPQKAFENACNSHALILTLGIWRDLITVTHVFVNNNLPAFLRDF